MDRRTYDQFCALATALDRIGERWTLLIVRELLLGPKRYSDLRVGLPGIAANLLALRLRTLEADGLVRKRRLPRPAASTVYELTDLGRELAPALQALTRWGARFMGTPRADQTVRSGWFALALQALASAEQLRGADGTFEVGPEEEPVTLRVESGAVAIADGPAAAPDARLTADPRLLFRIAAGGSTIDDEVAAGRATLEGDAAARRGLARAMRFPR